MRPEPRLRIADARLYLIFTPAACGAREPLEVLEAALPWIDAIQVRPKVPDRALDPTGGTLPLVQTSARDLFDWTVRVLSLVAARRADDVLVIANDRVDVAKSLLERGCAGVHLGQEDCPPDVARRLLGERALIGLSTHSAAQVVDAQELQVDYLGFGPVRATATKGYGHGLGCEAAWVASQSSAFPVFPIGGIGVDTIGELVPIGRAALSSAILGAPDPAAAARTLRELLLDPA